MRITRKGMNAIDTDFSIPLLDRWKYSKRLATWFNETKIESNQELLSLKKRLENYFETLKENGVEETPLYKVTTNQRSKAKDIIYLVGLFRSEEHTSELQ